MQSDLSLWERWTFSAALVSHHALGAREIPIRADRAGHAVECAAGQLGDQQAVVVDRAGHGCPALRHASEADAAVIGLVADQQDETVPLCLRIAQRAIEQRTPDAVLAKRRLDRQWSPHHALGVAAR